MMLMPLIFGVMFFFFPAGLVLYWLTNNILSIAQQWYVTKQIANAKRPLSPLRRRRSSRKTGHSQILAAHSSTRVIDNRPASPRCARMNTTAAPSTTHSTKPA